jgi:hypothetical protein
VALERTNAVKYLETIDISKCCPEAQADGVPCPTLGRSCEICERAVLPTAEVKEASTRPVGND